MHTAGEKNLSTGTRFKQVILKGFLRLDIQPVQQHRNVDLGRTELGTLRTCARVPRARARAARAKQIHQPSPLFRGAAAAAAFSAHTNRGKLLQHKLIRVQCTKKSTRIPVSPVPQYGYSV